MPVHNATLLTPDILDDPTPIVPFSATSITLLFGCFSCNFLISTWASSEIIHLPCNSLSALEWAWFPGESKSVEISPSAATYVTTSISSSISGKFVKNSALA